MLFSSHPILYLPKLVSPFGTVRWQCPKEGFCGSLDSNSLLLKPLQRCHYHCWMYRRERSRRLCEAFELLLQANCPLPFHQSLPCHSAALAQDVYQRGKLTFPVTGRQFTQLLTRRSDPVSTSTRDFFYIASRKLVWEFISWVHHTKRRAQ